MKIPLQITARNLDLAEVFKEDIREKREIYFHEHSVLNCDFKQLKVGIEVRFVEEQGEKGPQASTVTVIER